jgi:hypothetical protein
MILTEKKQPDIYQVKVTLEGIRPPIWRRILVTSDTTLSKLHRILQVVMGWADYHLHQFIINGTYYGIHDPDLMFDLKDEEKMKLDMVVLQKQKKFIYEYDFGDSWYHNIMIEKILPPDTKKHYPVCIKGKRACPPEDCGGEGGYYYFLEAIQDPEHPEHEEMLEWEGGSFDPEAFDIDEVNRILKKIR